MTESELEDLAAAYALGALDEAEAAKFEAALEEHPELRQRVAEYAESAAHVALSLESVATSPESKSQLMAYVSGSRHVTVPSGMKTHGGGGAARLPGGGLAWIVAGALAVLLAGMGWLALDASERAVEARAQAKSAEDAARALEAKLEEAQLREYASQQKAQAASHRLAVLEPMLERLERLELLLRDPATRVFHLVAKEGDTAHGRVFLRGKELVFFAYDLPRLDGRSYELWLQTPGGELKAAGVFTDADQLDRTVQGHHVLEFEPEPRAFYVSHEPNREGNPEKNQGPVVLGPAPP
jgi:anti-sigma-K factor RskA